MIKWILYMIWMVFFINAIGMYVVFPSVEIEQLAISGFVLGSGIITACLKFPKLGEVPE